MADMMSISNDEMRIWEKCDIEGVMSGLQLMLYDLRSDNVGRVHEFYDSLVERYKSIDISELNPKVYPVEAISQIRQKLGDLRGRLTRENIDAAIEDIGKLKGKFKTSMYSVYRSVVEQGKTES